MTAVRERLLKLGSEPAPSTPEKIANRVTDAIEQFGRIAKQLGIKPR